MSLDVLAKRGSAHLTITEVAHELGVTKGSFYHHFRDRAEFRREILGYWDKKYTRQITRDIPSDSGTPEDQLWQLLQAISSNHAATYDVVIRAWAAREPDLARLVRRTDRYRRTFVQSLFEAMGFSGDELEARTLSFMLTMSSGRPELEAGSAAQQKQRLKALHSFFTRR